MEDSSQLGPPLTVDASPSSALRCLLSEGSELSSPWTLGLSSAFWGEVPGLTGLRVTFR